MNKEVLLQNRKSWDTMADLWFETTALPVYVCLAPTEIKSIFISFSTKW